MKFPCKDCENRTETCHSTCEKYLEVKRKSDELREQRTKENVMLSYISCHKHRTRVEYSMKEKSLKFR